MRDRITLIGLLASALVIGASIEVWMSPTYRWQAGVWVFFPFGITSGVGFAINAWAVVIAWSAAWGVVAGLLLPLNDWRVWVAIGGICVPLFTFGTLFWVAGSFVFYALDGPCGVRGGFGGCPFAGGEAQTGPLAIALVIGFAIMLASAMSMWWLTRRLGTRGPAALATGHR